MEVWGYLDLAGVCHINPIVYCARSKINGGLGCATLTTLWRRGTQRGGKENKKTATTMTRYEKKKTKK